MAVLLAANLAVRLAVELTALVALARWGWRRRRPVPVRWLSALGAPLVAATIWATSAAPDAPLRLGALAAGVQVLVLGVAAAALVHSGRTRGAVAFGAVAVANATLMWLWDQ